MVKRDYDPRQSSIAVGDKKRKGGLLPLILGLLALLIIAAIVIGLVSCGDDKKKTVAATSTPAAPPAASTDAPATDAPATTTPAPATGGGTLVAGSQSLLGADASKIGDSNRQTATGTGVKVLALADSGSGFFVGTDDTDRQYVEFGGKVGADEAASTLPAVGDTVDLTGEVRPAPKSAGTTLKLSAADAQTVSTRGSYINADSVKPAAG